MRTYPIHLHSVEVDGSSVIIIIFILHMYIPTECAENRIRINSVLWPIHGAGHADQGGDAVDNVEAVAEGTRGGGGPHPKKRIRSRRGRE